MPVQELPSISFSVIPVASPSLPSPIVLPSYLLSLPSIIVYIPDLFCPFYVPSIIPQFCGWIIIVQHLCILVDRQLAYCLLDLMICFHSNTLLFYIEYFLYHYLHS